jgi:hypothetical protein
VKALGIRRGPAVPLPKDAILVELRADVLTFETRDCQLPGTVVSFSLVMEGQALPLQLLVLECLVTDKDRLGYIYQSRFSLGGLPEADRHLIGLFIAKGRGAPKLART